MNTPAFERALRQLEEQYNIIQPAFVLAEADQALFLPTLTTKSYEELKEIAREYKVVPASGRVTKVMLLTALTDSINNRREYTKREYTRICTELDQLKTAQQGPIRATALIQLQLFEVQ